MDTDNKTEDRDELEELRKQEYFERSGCGPILASLVVIVLFWVAVVIIKMYK